MIFRFVHMADVHLDTPFQNRDRTVRERMREGVREAFRAGIDLALEAQADAVLVAGDLFDNATLSFATEKFLLAQVSRLGERRVPLFYAPGNHDPWGRSYRLSRIPWPENVHVFSSRRPRAVPVEDREGRVKGFVCGAGHEGVREGDNLAREFPLLQEGAPRVALLHALVTGSRGGENHERYAPCSLEDMRGKGYQYWALGHVHTRSVLCEDPRVVYPGNIMGRHHREGGSRGAYLVEIDDRGAVRAEFHPLAPYTWLSLEIHNLAGALTYDALKGAIEEQAESALRTTKLNGRILLRITLSGRCPLCRELGRAEDREQLREDLQTALPIEFLELDHTAVTKPADPGAYRQGPHVLATALEILECLNKDDTRLLELSPEPLAGMERGAGREAALVYLRSLLPGLDVEAAARLVEVVGT